MTPTTELREKLFKQDRCQRCHRKVDQLYTVRYTNLERTKVVVEPATGESRNSFCEEHAEARRRVKERSVRQRAEAAKANGKPKPKPRRSRKAKAKA